MATLPDFVLRLFAAGILAVALMALGPKAAVAQTSDSRGGVKSGATTAQSDSSTEDDSAGAGRYELHTALKSFDTKPRPGDDVFDHAAELFPAFCKDWERSFTIAS